MTSVPQIANEVISFENACEVLKCSEAALLQMLASGEIPGLHFGVAWVIPRVAFIRAVNGLAIQAAIRRRDTKAPAEVLPAAKQLTADLAAKQAFKQTAATDRADETAPELVSALEMTIKFSDPEMQKRSRVLESYVHAGMLVRIYEFTGSSGLRDYFAVVVDPFTKRQAGETVGTSYSVKDTKKAAEAYAKAWAANGANPGAIAECLPVQQPRRGKPGRPPKRPQPTDRVKPES